MAWRMIAWPEPGPRPIPTGPAGLLRLPAPAGGWPRAAIEAAASGGRPLLPEGDHCEMNAFKKSARSGGSSSRGWGREPLRGGSSSACIPDRAPVRRVVRLGQGRIESRGSPAVHRGESGPCWAMAWPRAVPRPWGSVPSSAASSSSDGSRSSCRPCGSQVGVDGLSVTRRGETDVIAWADIVLGPGNLRPRHELPALS